MIIKVTIGTNTERKTITTENTTTINAVLTEHDINYSSCVIHLDGLPLSVSELNSTFESLNITNECSLLAVVKATNAVFA